MLGKLFGGNYSPSTTHANASCISPSIKSLEVSPVDTGRIFLLVSETRHYFCSLPSDLMVAIWYFKFVSQLSFLPRTGTVDTSLDDGQRRPLLPGVHICVDYIGFATECFTSNWFGTAQVSRCIFYQRFGQGSCVCVNTNGMLTLCHLLILGAAR